MATYRIEGSIVKTENAQAEWKEAREFDGNNHISVATGSQWLHQTLYRSRRGRYWVEHCSDYQGTRSHAEWASPEEAARWVLMNGHEIPGDLKEAAETVEE